MLIKSNSSEMASLTGSFGIRPRSAKRAWIKHFLYVVQCKATKDGETSVEPKVFGNHQCASGRGGDDKRCETGESDNGYAC